MRIVKLDSKPTTSEAPLRPTTRSVPSFQRAAAGVALSLFVGAFAASSSEARVCADVFGPRPTAGAIVGTAGRIYPKGVTRSVDKHFQFSYESEYLFSESAPLLRDYAPAQDVMPREAWLALSDADRIGWLKQRFQNRPEFATASGLRRIVDISYLPDELVVDSTGNVEIILNPPLNTLAEWRGIVRSIVARYGPGSQQAMISKPRESAFPNRGRQVGSAAETKQHLGWLVYTQLFDTFQKLESGAERFKKDPSKLTLASFDHPFLGPMTRMKRSFMERYLQANESLQLYDEDSKQFVRKSDASFKYTGGPSYRPDIAGPVRWSWEIRNAHKDMDDLIGKVERDVVAHVRGLEPYEPFANVAAFDSVADFNKLPLGAQDLLKQLFPSKADPRFEYSNDERLALETFRNFAYPMMQTEGLVLGLARTPEEHTRLRTSIEAARAEFVNALTALTERVNDKSTTEAEAKAKVMGLVGTWAVRSGLVNAFEEKARLLADDQSYVSQKQDQSGIAPAVGQ